MIFKKEFYEDNGRVDTRNKWVWVIHLISYLYVLYIYIFTDARYREISEAAKMWIPLDIILTINIVIYKLYYNLK